MKFFLLLCPLALAAAADLNHAPWDALLKRYVDTRHLVDYAAWKQQGTAELDSYLRQIAQPWPALSPDARKAATINAYNALTVRWVLGQYPVKSIWRTSDPFQAARHTVNGHKVSLDDLEAELRRSGDPRIHAAIVCASRSCPPLRREAYLGPRLNAQLDENLRAWLSDGTLNQFYPDKGLARVSMIFKWYRGDFEQDGRSLSDFLSRYAPSGRYPIIEFNPYHWGLNDSSGLGSDYSSVLFLIDRARNFL